MLSAHQTKQPASSARRLPAARQKHVQERPDRYFVSLEEAARTLDMSYFTLRDWGLSGRITTHKFGSKVKISNLEMDRIIAEAERPRLT